MKIRDVIKRLEDEDWKIVRQKGSHRQYRKARNPNVITVAGKESGDLKPGTLADIQRKAGWK